MSNENKWYADLWIVKLLSPTLKRKLDKLDQFSREIAICKFNETFNIWFNENTIAQMFNQYISFDS